MFKRTVWFTVGLVGGAVTGAGATAYGFVRWREARGALAPDRVADTLVSTARTVGSSARGMGASVGSSGRAVSATARANVREALIEGRLAMAEAELRIIAELERRDRGHGWAGAEERVGRDRHSPDGAAGRGQ